MCQQNKHIENFIKISIKIKVETNIFSLLKINNTLQNVNWKKQFNLKYFYSLWQEILTSFNLMILTVFRHILNASLSSLKRGSKILISFDNFTNFFKRSFLFEWYAGTLKDSRLVHLFLYSLKTLVLDITIIYSHISNFFTKMKKNKLQINLHNRITGPLAFFNYRK